MVELHNIQHLHSNNKNNNSVIIMSPNSSSPSTMISAHNDNDIISSNSSNDNDNTYLVEHLQFMQEQEENYYHPSAFAASYQHSSPEAAAAAASLYEDRRIMASWSYDIVDACSIDREMACIAMSYFDRFMCTPAANTANVAPSSSTSSRMSRRKFQLAFLTCLVIALKCRAGMQVDSPFVSETICQGMYSPQEIVEMESIVLNALQWRLNGPSPQEFVVGLLQLLPSSAHHQNQQQQINNKDKVCIIEKLKTLACSHIESSMLDHTMAVQLPSRIAYAALLVAMSKLGHDVLSPSDRYAWVQNIALVSGLTTTSTRAPTSSISTTTSEKSYCADRSKDVRQRRRRQQCHGGDRIPSSSSSSSSYPYSTRRHDNVVVVGHVIDDHDSTCDYEMGSSISCSSSRSSGSGGSVYATPDRRGIARSHHHHHHHAMTSMDPPETSMITEFYCTPVGGIGESYWNQRYCTPISNTSLSTSTSIMTFGTTAMAASRR